MQTIWVVISLCPQTREAYSEVFFGDEDVTEYLSGIIEQLDKFNKQCIKEDYGVAVDTEDKTLPNLIKMACMLGGSREDGVSHVLSINPVTTECHRHDWR